MKKINDQKLQAFSVGNMGKRALSRREQDELRKKEEEEAAANAFQEFVETFQEVPSNISKVWVKAGTYDAGSRREDSREKGKLYKPTSKIEEKTTADKAHEYAKFLASDSKKDNYALKKKSSEKKKSNLELFKEELRQIQEEREERHKYKNIARTMIPVPEPDPIFKDAEIGSFDNGDPNTTNLYLGNLSPKISEQQLMELFGRYGPLASIKIMWPRSEEEKSRGRNCGFVAYMSRKDAERGNDNRDGRGNENGMAQIRSFSEQDQDMSVEHAAISELQQTEDIIVKTVGQHRAMNDFLDQFLQESRELYNTTNYVDYDQNAYCKRFEEIFTQLAAQAVLNDFCCKDLITEFRSKLAREKMLSHNPGKR